MCNTCFVHGTWKIDNASPCFVSQSTDGGAPMLSGVVSTMFTGGMTSCPSDPTMTPTMPWSTDTLTTDCAGHYHLCVTLKAGDSKMPMDSDCTVVQTCADGDYSTALQAQKWTDLPGWMAPPTSLACAQKFQDQGGYAQLTATGTATGCGAITRTVGVITYCPQSCQANPTGAGCMNCVAGGSGTF